jgi:hypothetical protein
MLPLIVVAERQHCHGVDKDPCHQQSVVGMIQVLPEMAILTESSQLRHVTDLDGNSGNTSSHGPNKGGTPTGRSSQ